MPPPARSTGAADSTAACTPALPESAAVNAPIGPRLGTVAQTMAHGNRPRTTTTAMMNPQKRNHLRDFSSIVPRISALMTALSMLEMISNRQRPSTMRIMFPMCIERVYHADIRLPLSGNMTRSTRSPAAREHSWSRMHWRMFHYGHAPLYHTCIPSSIISTAERVC